MNKGSGALSWDRVKRLKDSIGGMDSIDYVRSDDARNHESTLAKYLQHKYTKRYKKYIVHKSSCCSWFVHFCMDDSDISDILVTKMSIRMDLKPKQQTEGCDLNGSTWGGGKYRRYSTWWLEHQRTLAVFVGLAVTSWCTVVHPTFFFLFCSFFFYIPLLMQDWIAIKP